MCMLMNPKHNIRRLWEILNDNKSTVAYRMHQWVFIWTYCQNLIYFLYWLYKTLLASWANHSLPLPKIKQSFDEIGASNVFKIIINTSAYINTYITPKLNFSANLSINKVLCFLQILGTFTKINDKGEQSFMSREQHIGHCYIHHYTRHR